MSRRVTTRERALLSFDVVYADGTRTSNRKVPSAGLQPWDFDGSVRAVIEAQDRDIGNRSGKPRAAIKSITPSRER